MFGLFRSKQEEQGLPLPEAIARLREAETMLLKKQELYEEKIDDQIHIAKANGVKNKRLAIEALKRKNRYAKELQRIDGQLSTLEMQRESLEETISNGVVVETLKLGSKTLGTAQKNYTVDDVHNIMENVAEQFDVSREISEAISTPFAQDISEDDLEKELEKLEQETLDEALSKVYPTDDVHLPAPIQGPVGEINVKVPKQPTHTDDEHLLAELSSWSS